MEIARLHVTQVIIRINRMHFFKNLSNNNIFLIILRCFYTSLGVDQKEQHFLYRHFMMIHQFPHEGLTIRLALVNAAHRRP